MMVLVSWIFVRSTPRRVDKLVPPRCSWCRRRRYSLGHGGNDAQKTIGIIWMLLIAAGYVDRRRRRCRRCG